MSERPGTAALGGSAPGGGRPGGGLRGHLRLVAAPDGRGRTVLRRQSFAAPVHLSKPHSAEEGTLVVSVVNPTAGLFAGDRLECRVDVEPGARLLLTTPSATRVHRMPAGETAAVVQEFTVAAGGSLAVWPEPLIPQAGASYRQQTRLRVAPGGELLFFETLYPGRVGFGELFAFRELDWETELFSGGHLAVRERYRLEPEGPAVSALRSGFAVPVYTGGLVVGPRFGAEAPCWPRLRALHAATGWVGVSPLTSGGEPAWVVRMVAEGTLEARRQLAAVRRALYAALGCPRPPGLRRVGTVD